MGVLIPLPPGYEELEGWADLVDEKLSELISQHGKMLSRGGIDIGTGETNVSIEGDGTNPLKLDQNDNTIAIGTGGVHLDGVTSNRIKLLDETGERECFVFRCPTSGDIILDVGGVISIDDTVIGSSTSPNAGSLYVSNLPKAWGVIEITAGPTATKRSGFNFDSTSLNTNDLTVNLFQAMTGVNNFAVTFMSSAVPTIYSYAVSDTDTFVVSQFNSTTGAAANFVAGTICSFIVFGDQ